MKQNYKGLFKGWEIGIAKNLINEFKNKWKCLEREDFDDLLQECLTHWFFVKDKYDSKREASKSGFMSRVIRNKLTDIVELKQTNKRKLDYLSISLNQALGNDKDSPALLDKLEDTSSNLLHKAHLEKDLSETLKKLTSQQKELCRLLSEEGMNIKKASEHLKIPRSTIYDEIKRIRAIFRKEKLENYLK